MYVIFAVMVVVLSVPARINLETWVRFLALGWQDFNVASNRSNK